jgi:hypothetical protein
MPLAAKALATLRGGAAWGFCGNVHRHFSHCSMSNPPPPFRPGEHEYLQLVGAAKTSAKTAHHSRRQICRIKRCWTLGCATLSGYLNHYRQGRRLR